jgi:hypothetical protein
VFKKTFVKILSMSGWDLSPLLKSKGKFVPVHNIKERGGIEVQLHSFISAALGGGKSLCLCRLLRYPPSRELAELQSPYRDTGEEKNLFFLLSGFEPTDRLAHSTVAITKTLSQLFNPLLNIF